jgi:hypothetical protein
VFLDQAKTWSNARIRPPIWRACAVACRPPLLANIGRFTHNSRRSLHWGNFMATFPIRSFHAGLMLATAFAVSMWPATSRAYTPEQEQACTSDAFRLCSSEIPNVERVTACMVAKKSQLSPPCRAQFRPDPEPSRASSGPAGRPMAISPATPRKSATAKRKASKQAKKPTKKPAKKPAST